MAFSSTTMRRSALEMRPTTNGTGSSFTIARLLGVGLGTRPRSSTPMRRRVARRGRKGRGPRVIELLVLADHAYDDALDLHPLRREVHRLHRGVRRLQAHAAAGLAVELLHRG